MDPEKIDIEQESKRDLGETTEKELLPDENLEKLEEEKTRERIGLFFNNHKNGDDRINELVSGLKIHLYAGFLDVEKIEGNLEKCSKIENREAFIENVFLAVKLYQIPL